MVAFVAVAASVGMLAATTASHRQSVTQAGGAVTGGPRIAGTAGGSVPLGGDCTRSAARASAPDASTPVLGDTGFTLKETDAATVTNCGVAHVAGLFEVPGGGPAAPTALLAVWGPGADVSAGSPTGSPTPSDGNDDSATSIRGTTGRVTSTPNALTLSWREPDGTTWVATSNGLSVAKAVALIDSLTLDPAAGTAMLDPSTAPSIRAVSPTAQLSTTATATRTVYHFTSAAGDLDVTVYHNSDDVTGLLLGTLTPLGGLSFPDIRGQTGAAGTNGPDTHFVTFPAGPTTTVTVVGAFPLARLTQLAEGITLPR